MKRILALLLCLSLLLAGCGSAESEETTQSQVVESTATTVSTEATIESEPPVPQVATIIETVLVDECGVKITATGLEGEGYRGPEVKLLIENNTDTDLTFQIRNVSVNCCMVDSLMSENVAAGKKQIVNSPYINPAWICTALTPFPIWNLYSTSLPLRDGMLI